MGRGIALLLYDRGSRKGWVVSSTPRPHFTPGKDPVPIVQEAGWAPGPVLIGGKSRPHGDSIPYCPARSQSIYRLSYRAHLGSPSILPWVCELKTADVWKRHNRDWWGIMQKYWTPEWTCWEQTWIRDRKYETKYVPQRLLSRSVVATQCSRNHFICEKYETVRSFKLHFLQNSHLLRLHTSASDSKGVGNVPRSHFVKALWALPSHS